jgi:hypothetical protein
MPPTVQWQVSTNGGGTWENIGGATNTTYALSCDTADNATQYRAIFANVAGSATTLAATLTVLALLVVDGGNDFDGDGKPDLFWRNYGTGRNVLWFMDGTS